MTVRGHAQGGDVFILRSLTDEDQSVMKKMHCHSVQTRVCGSVVAAWLHRRLTFCRRKDAKVRRRSPAWARYLDPLPPMFHTDGETCEKVCVATFDAELYEQANGPKTSHRCDTFPENRKGRVPAVVVPLFSEAMIDSNWKRRRHCEICRYHYLEISPNALCRHFSGCHNLLHFRDPAEGRFKRWRQAGARQRRWPGWRGIGKLTHDTRLLVDMLGGMRGSIRPHRIIGHSLGSKMASTPVLDSRIKVIVASDFGIAGRRRLE